MNASMGVFLSGHAPRRPDTASGQVHVVELATNRSKKYVTVYVTRGVALAYKASLVLVFGAMFAVLLFVPYLNEATRLERLRQERGREV